MVALYQTRLTVCLLAPENSSLSVQLHRRCLMFIRALDTCWTRLRVLHDQLPHVFMTGKDDAVELFGLCGERLRPAVHYVLTICIRHGLSAFVGTKMCNVLVLRVTSSPPRHRMNSSCLPTGAVEPPTVDLPRTGVPSGDASIRRRTNQHLSGTARSNVSRSCGKKRPRSRCLWAEVR